MKHTDIQWKNVELTDWLLQIEKVALLTNSQENELPTATLTSTLYKMLKGMGRDRNWQSFTGISTKCYGPNVKAMGVDPANITNWVKIFLLI